MYLHCVVQSHITSSLNTHIGCDNSCNLWPPKINIYLNTRRQSLTNFCFVIPFLWYSYLLFEIKRFFWTSLVGQLNISARNENSNNNKNGQCRTNWFLSLSSLADLEDKLADEMQQNLYFQLKKSTFWSAIMKCSIMTFHEWGDNYFDSFLLWCYDKTKLKDVRIVSSFIILYFIDVCFCCDVIYYFQIFCLQTMRFCLMLTS